MVWWLGHGWMGSIWVRESARLGLFLTAFVCRQLADIVLLQDRKHNPQAMQVDYDNQVTALLRGDDEAWRSFLFNVEQARRVRDALEDKTAAAQLIGAGRSYSGTGWTTSKAAKALYETTEVAVVSSKFADYRDIWLYTLVNVLGIEIPELDLDPKLAEASFALSAAVSGEF